MINESGNVSINAENIFPIIKKWLYSEKDIFIRELASNCSDAINKHRKLVAIGEAPAPEGEAEKYFIAAIVDRTNKTLSFADNGIGMTADEVKSYINQIAFSGAQDFLEKYKDKMGDGDQIIGHFGLGFYSSFMVSDKVEIDTLSWQEGAEAVNWASEGGMDYAISASGRATRGTTVKLYLAEDSQEFLETFKLREVLRKYCSFMPYPIIVVDVDQEAKDAKDAEEKAAKEAREAAEKAENAEKAEDAEKHDHGGHDHDHDHGDHDHDHGGHAHGRGGESDFGVDGEPDFDGDGDAFDIGDAIDADADLGAELAADDSAEKKTPYNGKLYDPINNTAPLWQKAPKDCTDAEYKEFYRDVFFDFDEPLFWIHLNMDYPFNLKGILYFPKMKHEFETMEGQIKLFYNQVFVADNIKEVIPEFLLLLKGCLDCPDLPLNVSRSFLQNDSYVRKISAHITKKVGDKLTSLYESAREEYNKYWDDINPFIKYGCIKENNFYDRVKDIIIYKDIDGKYVTLKQYLEAAKDKHENTVFYVSDEKQQSQYIRLFKDNGMDAVLLKSMLDNHFIQFLESKEPSVKLRRIDSDISDSLKAADADVSKEDAEAMEKALEAAFRRAAANDKLKVKIEPLKSPSIPGMLLLSEYARRMQDMSRMYGGAGGMDMESMFPQDETLVLNSNNKLIKSISRLERENGKPEEVGLACRHIYDMAVLGNKPLEPDAMTQFLERSGQLLEKLL
jgi:molecular chaperone HtpG